MEDLKRIQVEFLNSEILGEHIRNAYKFILGKYKNITPLISPMSRYLFEQFFNTPPCGEDNSTKLEIEIGYHGTTKEVLDSIVNFGMLDPTSAQYKVRNGNVHGKGVYVSPSLQFAQGYNRGCVLVLLFIRGNACQGKGYSSKDELDSDHYSPCRDIVVLRSTTQVLPIFAASEIGKSDIPIEDLFSEIKFDEEVLKVATEINEIDMDVNVLVIYNLLLRELTNPLRPSVDIDNLLVAKEIVVNKISDFDYTYY